MGVSVRTEPVDGAQLDRWRQRLSNMTELILPTDYPRPIPNHVVEAEQILAIPETTALAILQLSLGIKPTPANSGNSPVTPVGHISPFTILLSAFVVLLHKYTGEEDVSVGSSSSSSNPLVLRLRVSDDDTMEDVVRNVLKTEDEAGADEIPFASLLEALFPPQADAEDFQPSLFKVRFFNLTDTNPDTLNSTTNTSTCDITIFISQAPTLRRLLPIEVRVLYNTVLFSDSRIRDMLDQLQLVLETAAKDPRLPIGRISLLTDQSKKVLPDPQANLHWDGFEGAITDIFARNAKAHPDRTCVVESRWHSEADSPNKEHQEAMPSPLREFSYHAINRASNIVAHCLMKHGIEREDVVVLYSYRGVDLVVAVMGVLKAGATFSVIDPAYPPSRQNIYLSVAQPRGLVILRKAGILHDDVRKYIDKTLQIKCEIPSLEILDDGSLVGGKTPDGGKDLFDDVRDLADKEPGVVLGPDSIGTLSFTSGSTGIPKGVRGRHFSLTHFYPWMKGEFGLSEKDRFTMLSGIAHDPIQRDIFTPLFLGAQLRIPTAEDIGTPGRLAEWMAEHEVTVTHLTPAMGQLLSANAVHPIPTLRNAFFVGDVLTKRDVSRLQFLAAHTNIINMYGTTETQRAVSYLKIPPTQQNPGFLSKQKDIMPAGKGMRNVQLLVVNKAGLLCGVGEVGELYVRSGGLAEGYLRLEDVTAAKFLSNPFNPNPQSPSQVQIQGPDAPAWTRFYKGLRDRMYRTGDLGRYRPDGSVECTGRADDQVKIRGFRIELGEIDTHLSQHPSVRENVTLVRRDKYEEKTLVTYFVALGDVEDMAELVKDIREYLKLKLPSYAVPSVFVPLTRLPLTPNGKIDKNALPFPDTALIASLTSSSTTDSDSNLTPTEKSIRNIWSTLLNLPATAISIDDNFFDRGGHSILATRLVFEMRKNLAAADVALGIVYREPTIRGMAREVDRELGGALSFAAGQAVVGGSQEDVSPTSAETQMEGKGHTPMASPGRQPLRSTKSTDNLPTDAAAAEFDYGAEVEALDDITISATAPTLVERTFVFPTLDVDVANQPRRVVFFLTGVTGFLGAFILSTLLKRYPNSRAVCHVRAKSEAEGLDRVRDNAERHLVWDEEWISGARQGPARVSVVCGDLAAPRLGVGEGVWDMLAREVDVVVHNGALVHWVYPYHKLRAPNVQGTIEALKLCTTHHLKPFHFISSTSVLDTDHYVRKLGLGLTQASAAAGAHHHATSSSSTGTKYLTATGGAGRAAPSLSSSPGRGGIHHLLSEEVGVVLESDDLEGARKGLRSGYGQSKWVAEKLVMRARDRGVPATIIRPGYIVGHSKTGVGNTDDFLWRLVKGCIQLGEVPRIANVVNMCPVDYVASAVAAIVGSEENLELGIFHIWNPHRFRFDDMFTQLMRHGYAVTPNEYMHWRTALMDLTLSTADHALFPLLHFVLDDLPTSTKSAELDDRNTRAACARAKQIEQGTESLLLACPDMNALMGLYLGYLVGVGFLDTPPSVPKVAEAGAVVKEGQKDGGEEESVKKTVAVLPSLPEWESLRGRMVARSGK
ncbi:large subunit of alpha-aminoadipate reductase [Quaeritorhiza haematococci]|nr:large subunit of alpha-aminoadipate reductase [Quaeritorhiza haematococci]